jgi:hypothetical protein
VAPLGEVPPTVAGCTPAPSDVVVARLALGTAAGDEAAIAAGLTATLKRPPENWVEPRKAAANAGSR